MGVLGEVLIRPPGGESRVVIGDGLLDDLPGLIMGGLGYLPNRHLLLIDSAIPRSGGGIVGVFNSLPGLVVVEVMGESSKSLESVFRIYGILVESGFHRDDAVVAVGGGATTDLAGFVAGTYMRGLPLVNVPTTILGMIDGAVGGKSGINYGNAKNVIGVFHQPRLVVVDIGFLDTLGYRDYRSGFAEAIKYGVVLDRGLLDFLESERDSLLSRDHGTLARLIEWCVRIKGRVVEMDERELSGYRMSLNFGHTVGHALELRLGLTHGEAVALGMIVEGDIAVRLGTMSRGDYETMERLIMNYGLPTRTRVGLSMQELRSLVLMDKKARGGDHVIMPLPASLGSFRLKKVPIDEVVMAIQRTLGGP